MAGPARPAPRLRPTNRSSSSKRSKSLRAADAKIDQERLYAPLEAVRLAKETSTTKFDSTVEVAFRLGVDPRKADQMVRGTVNLPHGTGKTARVLVFATGDRAAAAEAAGADIVGSDELIDEVAKGRLDFDAVVATPDLMGKVGRLGRVLGPRGLMPNPKTGTVTPDVAKAVTEIKGGKIEFRVDKHSNLHFIIGKVSFDETSWWRTTQRRWTRSCGSSRPRPRAVTSRRLPCPPPWAPASRSTPTAPATSSSRRTRRPSDDGAPGASPERPAPPGPPGRCGASAVLGALSAGSP